MADLTNQECTVIQSYAFNDMNTAATAKKCFMSRNGLYYHLDKIKGKTGLNPRKFYDLIKLLELVKGRKNDGT